MLPFVKALVATPARLAVAGSVAVMVVAGGLTTFGAWTVGGSGAGYAKAVTVVNLTTANVSATTVADLYPGGVGDVKLSVVNSNPFPATITAVTAGTAATTTPTNATCDASTGVTFTTTTGLTLTATANATTDFTLVGKAAMSSASVNACQGLTFTLPVTLTATT